MATRFSMERKVVPVSLSEAEFRKEHHIKSFPMFTHILQVLAPAFRKYATLQISATHL
jgi:hypothetical protein